MCTAVYYKSDKRYFGRTLDYDITFGQQLVLMPRNFRLDFRNEDFSPTHYAVLGMAAVREGYPLYFDALNEKGLCMAGLNFSKSAQYFSPRADKHSVASFELIPWLLSRCDSVDSASELLESTLITDTAFSVGMPPSKLHWMIADSKKCAVIEQTADGLRLYRDNVGILTNEPTFEKQLQNLERYSLLTPDSPEGDSRGLGAVGLPGDLSSMSRFVRAEFVNRHSPRYDNESESVCQFFHILGSVYQTKGSCKVDGRFEYTQYSCCMSGERGVYYYSTYSNPQITAVDMNRENLNSTNLVCYPPVCVPKIQIQN